jgi:hypothetical protein
MLQSWGANPPFTDSYESCSLSCKVDTRGNSPKVFLIVRKYACLDHGVRKASQVLLACLRHTTASENCLKYFATEGQVFQPEGHILLHGFIFIYLWLHTLILHFALNFQGCVICTPLCCTSPITRHSSIMLIENPCPFLYFRFCSCSIGI